MKTFYSRSTSPLRVGLCGIILFTFFAAPLNALEQAGIQNAPEPHVQSGFFYRVINRKFVSHILYELKGDKHCLVLVTTHGPSYWAVHSRSHPLYYECGSPARCLREIAKVDKYLKSGENMRLKLKGSWIQEIRFLKPR